MCIIAKNLRMRTLVIGDIHSALKGLKQILERANVSSDDKLVFLGDYIDAWSDAVETIDFLIQLEKSHNCIFIRGNHDELCRDWLLNKKDNPQWLAHGGGATQQSYSRASKETIKAHLDFYGSLQNYYLDTDNRLYLHAGYTNLKGVTFEYFEEYFYWDRTLWELAKALDSKLLSTDKNYPKRLTHYHEIFIGHTPLSKVGIATPENGANVWNIDTGAAFKGPLTIMDVETKEFWQSDPTHTLYLGEKGRN